MKASVIAKKIFGRLSFKIGIATAAIAWVSIEVVVQLVFQQGITNTRESVRRDLTVLANVAVQTISGDDHLLATVSHDSAAFERVRLQMSKLRTASDFTEHWYTFVPSSTDTAYFGVMTHPRPFSGDRHIFRDENALQTYRKSLQRKEACATDVYKDDNGVWISGFAPICAHDGTVTGVLELDLTYTQLLAREASVRDQIVIVRVVGFFVGGLLGFLIGVIVARPLRMVSRTVARLAATDFHSGSNTELSFKRSFFPDETTTLITNVNQMAVQLDDTLQRLRDANDRLQTLDKAKTVFLDFVAHELRTPLTQLHAIELLRRMENLSEDGQFLVESAMGSIDRLRVFCFAAEQYVKALTHTPQHEEISDLQEIVPLIANEASELPEGTGVRFELHLPPDDAQVCVGVSYRIMFSMLLTIFHNATKFGQGGGKVIIILADDAVNGNAVITVQDFGVGFAPQLASRIFEPFFVEEIEHHGRGTGVNLASAKVYAEHYGGTLSARSAGKGLGSTFTIILPLYSTPKNAFEQNTPHNLLHNDILEEEELTV